MEVGMKMQVLSPTMEYGKEADFRSQMFGIASNGGQGLGHGTKQNVVDDLFVLVSEGSDLFGDGEDHMEIVGRENFGRSLLDPLSTREGLALWAMAVSAAVVARPLVITAIAAFEMPAQSCGATHLDRGHDASLGSRERPLVLLTIGFAVAAEDIRHFLLRALHRSGDQKVGIGVGFTSMETGRGSRSRGLEVEQTLLVATCKYCAVVAKLRWPSRS